MASKGSNKRRPHHEKTGLYYSSSSISDANVESVHSSIFHTMKSSTNAIINNCFNGNRPSFLSIASSRTIIFSCFIVFLLTVGYSPSLKEILPFLPTYHPGNRAQLSDTKDVLQISSDGKYHGKYPNSLLTLFFPFTLLRDVVLDQPVASTDIPFFWNPHVSDSLAVKNVLTACYDADLLELESLEDVARAKELDLLSTLVRQGRLGTRISHSLKQNYYNGQISHPLVITSPHIREVAELFSQENYGRMFSIYRHPIDYDIHPQLKQKLPPEASVNNFFTRLLSSVHSGSLGFKELGIAKQVIRQVTVSGTHDLMFESLFRIGKYFGWVPVGGLGTKDSEESDDNLVKTCIENLVQKLPGERYADHNSPEWQVFYRENMMDCQLYELARSTWRAQIQTIIPLTLQKQRAGEGDEDKQEDKNQSMTS